MEAGSMSSIEEKLSSKPPKDSRKQFIFKLYDIVEVKHSDLSLNSNYFNLL